MTAGVLLKPGREKPVLSRHPWVYKSALKRLSGDPRHGEIVSVQDSRGRFLAWGYFNGNSQIALRLMSWNPDEHIDSDFWRRRLAAAWLNRDALAKDPSTDAYRLVNAESDGLPGLIVDRYGSWLVIQFLIETRHVFLPYLLPQLEVVSFFLFPSARQLIPPALTPPDAFSPIEAVYFQFALIMAFGV